MDLRPGERLDDLGRAGLRIIQHPGRFPFAIDAVLLAHFATVKGRQRVLDLGTGCGVIPLLLAGRHPLAEITGLEIQPETADMAARSVELNGLTGRVHIDCGDYRQLGTLYGYETFDVVTINPPYREPGRGRVAAKEARAIARHEVMGSLSHTVKAAAAAVRFKGRVAVVFLAERLVELISQMHAHGLEPKRMRMVHPRTGRSANLVLLEAVKGGGPGLAVEPPLFIHDEGPGFTAEVQAIYDAKSGPGQ